MNAATSADRYSEYSTSSLITARGVMVVELQAARFTSEVTPDGYRVVIPARRNWFVLVFLCAWLAGWSFGELTAAGELTRGSGKAPVAFHAFWLTAWTIGGALAFATVLWQLAGREIITISPTMLYYRTEAFGIGRTRSFRISEVKDLRPTQYVMSPFANQRAWYPPPFFRSGFGAIAFDYGARTFRIAASLDEAEAKLLVKELSTQLPSSS